MKITFFLFIFFLPLNAIAFDCSKGLPKVGTKFDLTLSFEKEGELVSKVIAKDLVVMSFVLDEAKDIFIKRHRIPGIARIDEQNGNLVYATQCGYPYYRFSASKKQIIEIKDSIELGTLKLILHSK